MRYRTQNPHRDFDTQPTFNDQTRIERNMHICYFDRNSRDVLFRQSSTQQEHKNHFQDYLTVRKRWWRPYWFSSFRQRNHGRPNCKGKGQEENSAPLLDCRTLSHNYRAFSFFANSQCVLKKLIENDLATCKRTEDTMIAPILSFRQFRLRLAFPVPFFLEVFPFYYTILEYLPRSSRVAGVLIFKVARCSWPITP